MFRVVFFCVFVALTLRTALAQNMQSSLPFSEEVISFLRDGLELPHRVESAVRDTVHGPVARDAHRRRVVALRLA